MSAPKASPAASDAAVSNPAVSKRAFPRVLTPGPYLKYRRQAKGLTLREVAARIPFWADDPEHLRTHRLALIEADAAPASFSTIVALRRAYPFDMHVLSVLESIRQGGLESPPRLCRICACSEEDACPIARGQGCGWVADDLCSAHGEPRGMLAA